MKDVESHEPFCKKKKQSESDEMTTLYHTLFVDRMYSLEHNNMTSLLL